MLPSKKKMGKDLLKRYSVFNFSLKNAYFVVLQIKELILSINYLKNYAIQAYSVMLMK